MASRVSQWRRPLLVAAIVLIALLLRLRAAFLLPVDFDEPTYLGIASQYASALQAGDLWAVATLNQNIEHPALVKLLYGVELAIFTPPSPGSGGAGAEVALQLARGLSVLCGSGQVLLLALLNPLAGAALAVHTMTIKYTSQAYLEAVPGFFALLAIIAFERYRTSPPTPPLGGEGRTPPSLGGKGGWGVRSLGWLALSALALGAAIAGKYPYAVVGLAMLPFLPWRQRAWRPIIAFALIALVTFFILDPALWPDPLGRLGRSLFFHPLYSQSAQVTRFNLPWWQPLEYLSQPVPWHPGVFYVDWDGWIFLLGLLGLPFLWRRSRPYTAWLILGLAVLLVWPTKWPQYTLIVIPPLCLSLAYAVTDVARWANERFEISDYLEPFALPQYTWVLTGAFLLVIAVVFFLGAFLRWQNNLGWLQINVHNSGLLSNYVQVLAADKNDRLWIGSNAGLAMLDGQTWAAYTVESGALPSNDVRALAVADGTLWVGTGRGISTFDGSRWRSFLAGDAGGPASDDVRGLAVAADGRVWAATTGGLSVFDGRTWATYRAGNSGLPSDLVFTVATDPAGRVWAGTDRGVGVFDPQTQSWTRYDPANSGLQWPAVSTIAVDPSGRLWLGTLGGGLAVFDGQSWQSFTTANSDLPWNTIMSIAASPQGDVWLAADLPSAAGGNVARWDGHNWKTFTTQRSGIASGSATCFAFDRQSRVWIGMRTSGLSVYTPR